MAGGLSAPAGWVVEYNEFTFPIWLEPPTVEVSSVLDSAGRVVVGVRYKLTLSCHIHTDQLGSQPSDLDEQFELIRQQLTQPAGRLRVAGLGFGELDVNAIGGAVRDMAWGPRPALISCRNVSDDRAWHIKWQVETIIPELCPDESAKFRAMEFCYSPSWSQDLQGHSTRTITGHVTIPLTRRRPNDLTIDHTADELYEAVAAIPLIPNFRRIYGDRKLSEDRRRLDFTVRDVQLESPWSPPPGIVLIDANHSMRTAKAHSLFQWIHSLDAKYTVSRGWTKGIAWKFFQAYYRDKWRRIHQSKGVFIIVLGLSANDSTYTQATSFGMTFTATMSKAANPNVLSDAILNSGMYIPPPRHDWKEWSASLNGTAFDPRGVAKLRFLASDDQAITICAPGKTPLIGTGRSLTASSVPPIERDGFTPPPLPPRENSWVLFRSRFRIVPRDRKAIIPLLPSGPVQAKPRKHNLDSDDGWRADYPAKPRAPFIVQERGEPLFYLEWEGEAVRAGYMIDEPYLEAAGGQKLIPLRWPGYGFEVETLADFITPLTHARWRLLYLLDGTPTSGIYTPPNPLLGGVTRKASGGGGGLGGGGFGPVPVS